MWDEFYRGHGSWSLKGMKSRVSLNNQIEERLFPERIVFVKGMAGTMVQGRHSISKVGRTDEGPSIQRSLCTLQIFMNL